MVGRGPFTPAHVMSIAARAAELERIGEEVQDPLALVRAARLYTLAVRIADEIDGRAPARFTRSDLARARDELRELAAHAAAASTPGESGLPPDGPRDTRDAITVAFREIAIQIEARVLNDEQSRPRRDSDRTPRA